MKIAIEEAFATQSLVGAWIKLLEDGVPGEAGLDQHLGRLITAKSGWGGSLRPKAAGALK